MSRHSLVQVMKETWTACRLFKLIFTGGETDLPMSFSAKHSKKHSMKNIYRLQAILQNYHKLHSTSCRCINMLISNVIPVDRAAYITALSFQEFVTRCWWESILLPRNLSFGGNKVHVYICLQLHVITTTKFHSLTQLECYCTQWILHDSRLFLFILLIVFWFIVVLLQQHVLLRCAELGRTRSDLAHRTWLRFLWKP